MISITLHGGDRQKVSKGRAYAGCRGCQGYVMTKGFPWCLGISLIRWTGSRGLRRS